jgi:hypothetical protein
MVFLLAPGFTLSVHLNQVSPGLQDVAQDVLIGIAVVVGPCYFGQVHPAQNQVIVMPRRDVG